MKLERLIVLQVLTLIGSVVSEPLEYFFETYLDHKYTMEADAQKFNMRYIVDDQYFYDDTPGPQGKKPHPIFFYTGNQGDIWKFYENSGFVTRYLAEEYGALVVFAEHRYFGISLPFEKEHALNPGNNTYLTVEQTMMDYINLVKYLKTWYNADDKAVIGFGGSYGAMLATWIRMKHPHVFQGVLASSAPILYFTNSSTSYEWSFAAQASIDFRDAGPNCYTGIKSGFNNLTSSSTIPMYRKYISEVFNTCDQVETEEDVKGLIKMLQNGFIYMAMTDYPYPADYFNPMPAWPVNVSCQAYKDWKIDDPEVLVKMRKAADIFFNYKNDPKFCYNFREVDATGSVNNTGWDVLRCNELTMPITMGLNNNSMFVNKDDNFDYDKYTKHCQDKYGLTPRYNWAFETFGSYNYTREFKDYYNIIFTNGKLDPWVAGGVSTMNGKLDMPIYIMSNASHHLDLRYPNHADPSSVIMARSNSMQVIGSWVSLYQNKKKDTKGNVNQNQIDNDLNQPNDSPSFLNDL